MSTPPAPANATKPVEETSERPREFIQSLERGLAIIRAFGADAPEQTVTELAAKTQLTRATTRRFLITLVQLGYVETDGRVFRLTPRLLELGYAFLSGLGFPDVALPHLERLVAEVGESSEASILDGDDIVYVVRVPSSTIMTVSINVGARMPAHATSMGHVLLADLPDEELDAYLARASLDPYQAQTVTDRDVLRARVLHARADGYAIVDQELEEGLIAIAVPVGGRDGRAIAAINLSTHVARRSVESLRTELLEPLRRTARLIEADLVGSAVRGSRPRLGGSRG
jgi:IclR family pca regulon transcriptional regulator